MEARLPALSAVEGLHQIFPIQTLFEKNSTILKEDEIHYRYRTIRSMYAEKQFEDLRFSEQITVLRLYHEFS